MLSTATSLLPLSAEPKDGELVIYYRSSSSKLEIGRINHVRDDIYHVNRMEKELPDSEFYTYRKIHFDYKYTGYCKDLKSPFNMFVYSFPDAGMNDLLRSLPLSAVKDILDIRSDFTRTNLETDVFGTPLKEGDIVIYNADDDGSLLLGRVATIQYETLWIRELTTRKLSSDKKGYLYPAAKWDIWLLPNSQENKDILAKMSDEEIIALYR
jgi:hypothetical protein